MVPNSLWVESGAFLVVQPSSPRTIENPMDAETIHIMPSKVKSTPEICSRFLFFTSKILSHRSGFQKGNCGLARRRRRHRREQPRYRQQDVETSVFAFAIASTRCTRVPGLKANGITSSAEAADLTPRRR